VLLRSRDCIASSIVCRPRHALRFLRRDFSGMAIGRNQVRTGPVHRTTRSRLAGFGGYAAIENRPADDLLVGRLIAEQGYEVRLLRYSVHTVSDYHSMEDLFRKRLRWIVVMRHMRPAGHLGLLFTHGLPWALLACWCIRRTWWPPFI